jgi:hypothetical protein
MDILQQEHDQRLVYAFLPRAAKSGNYTQFKGKMEKRQKQRLTEIAFRGLKALYDQKKIKDELVCEFRAQSKRKLLRQLQRTTTEQKQLRERIDEAVTHQ